MSEHLLNLLNQQFQDINSEYRKLPYRSASLAASAKVILFLKQFFIKLVIPKIHNLHHYLIHHCTYNHVKLIIICFFQQSGSFKKTHFNFLCLPRFPSYQLAKA